MLLQIPHLYTVHCIQTPSFSVLANIMHYYCQDLLNIYFKAVKNQQFNQSDHDTRFCHHGTAASTVCLQAAPLCSLNRFLTLVSKWLCSLNFLLPPQEPVCRPVQTVLIQRSIKPHFYTLNSLSLC